MRLRMAGTLWRNLDGLQRMLSKGGSHRQPCFPLPRCCGTIHISVCRGSRNGQGIEPPNIRALAKMAQLSVTDEEVEQWEPQLQQIVSWFDQLQAVDVEGVPPAVRADVGDDNILRPDEPVPYDSREALLSQVPEREGEFVKVPKIV